MNALTGRVAWSRQRHHQSGCIDWEGGLDPGRGIIKVDALTGRVAWIHKGIIKVDV